MTERQPGWYWVKFCAEWECAKWTGSGWRRGNVTTDLRDETFSEIGPRIPTPDEPWQMVPVELIADLKELAEDDPGFREHLGLDLYERLAAAPKLGGES